jgi:ribose transport system substrate-binding protein
MTLGRRKLALLAMPLAMTIIAAGESSSSNASESGASAQATAPFDKSSTWRTVKVPVGNGQTITVIGPPRIAYFPAGGENNYLTVRDAAVFAAVKKIPGATVTMLDADWVASKQRDMIENSISSGKFNAFIVDTDDANSECNLLTKTAPAANIAVVNVSTPICGLYSKPDGRDHVANGTIGAVGNNNVLAIRDYLLYMIRNNPGAQNVIVVTGPPLHPLTPEINAALALINTTNPQFHIIANVTTDFSTLNGYQKTASLLVSHPDTTIIFSAYADITAGAVTAVKAAGLLGKIKIYDQFGNKAIVDDIRKGSVAATTGGYPVGSADAAVSMIRSAFEGRPFPRTILGDGGPVPADAAKWNGVTIIDKNNLDTYSAEF